MGCIIWFSAVWVLDLQLGPACLADVFRIKAIACAAGVVAKKEVSNLTFLAMQLEKLPILIVLPPFPALDSIPTLFPSSAIVLADELFLYI